jgi:hypothetical protein
VNSKREENGTVHLPPGLPAEVFPENQKSKSSNQEQRDKIEATKAISGKEKAPRSLKSVPYVYI